MLVNIDDIIRDGVTEVVVTTVSLNGVPNAAPMGIVRHGDRIFIRMYRDTTTFRNIAETGYMIANITTDASVFVISAFKELTPEYFQFEEGIIPPRLKEVSGYIFFKCQVDDVVLLEPVSYKVAKCSLPTFNRGFAAVLEATIVGTRLHLYKGDEGKKKIREFETVVKKCGSIRDIEAMKKLKEILGLI